MAPRRRGYQIRTISPDRARSPDRPAEMNIVPPEMSIVGGRCWQCAGSMRAKARGRIACEHIFCFQCISEYWIETQDNRCPVCEEPFHEIREERQLGIRPNFLPAIRRSAPTIGFQRNLENLPGRFIIDARTSTITMFGLHEDAAPRDICGVCWKDITDDWQGKLPCCDHLFCFKCIWDWASINPVCPMCRGSFYQIISHFSESRRLTRRMSKMQNLPFDVAYGQWVRSGNEDLELQFLQNAAPFMRCIICQRPARVVLREANPDEHVELDWNDLNPLRSCQNCFSLIHDTCAVPIWQNGVWKCHQCAPPPPPEIIP